MLQPERPQMTIWRMRIACWLSKATDTHLQYVILIAFPLQQWLHGDRLFTQKKYRYTSLSLVGADS